jgi:hypothetical protein
MRTNVITGSHYLRRPWTAYILFVYVHARARERVCVCVCVFVCMCTCPRRWRFRGNAKSDGSCCVVRTRIILTLLDYQRKEKNGKTRKKEKLIIICWEIFGDTREVYKMNTRTYTEWSIWHKTLYSVYLESTPFL